MVKVEFFYAFIFVVVSTLLAFLIFYLSYFISSHNPDIEKESAYECGFDPFDDTRTTFDVRFYLVSILFIIFDLEVTFLFPWTVSFGQVGIEGYIIMLIFLIILTVGFVFEWQKGALEWE